MSASSKSGECVKVIIRCRPINSKEKNDGHKMCVQMNGRNGLVEVRDPKNEENNRRFTFDAVYDWNSQQKDLYDETFRDLVQSVLEGFNGTIFAYGQTGTGKTFTMQGVKEDPELSGVIPRSFDHIFNHISRSTDAQYLVRASYLEIYKEMIRDLLHKDQNKRLSIKENPETGVYVHDLSSVLANSYKELDNVMHIGNKNRSVGPTNMNEHSSRSHAIFIITIECSQTDAEGENHIRVGKLNMVDLAGSERQSKTHSEGERLKEATKINLSLSALGNVISALVDGKSSHIPYRDSKLTRLLQDSLGGNSKTVMVANIGPASYNYDETVNTLRYANRAKNIKNKPKINEDPKDALLREYQEKIERMRKMLESKGGSLGDGKKKKKSRRLNQDGTGYLSEDSESEDEESNARAYHEQKMAELDLERQAIMANQNMVEEEKDRLLQQMLKQEEDLGQELANKEELEKQIRAMESKVLRGDKDIAQHTREQEEALERQRKEILTQKVKQREIAQQMAEEEENLTKMKEEKMNLNQEVELHTKRMKKLKETICELKLERNQLKEENRINREEQVDRQESLMKELKLKELILENFVASEEVKKLKERVQLVDEAEGIWMLQPLTGKGGQKMQPRPISAIGGSTGRRPESLYSRNALLRSDCSPRHRSENVLILELDPPGRTTHDYEPPKMAPQLAAALETALQDEGDIELDGSPSIFKADGKLNSKRREKRSKGSASGGGSKTNQSDKEMFPTSRGLVDKQMK